MVIRSRATATATAAALLVLAAAPSRSAEPFSHADWGKVLGKFVDAKGYVSYAALAKDRVELDRYVAALEATSPRSAPDRFPTRNDKLAYYLNAYNATVFKGVLGLLAKDPKTDSVWGGLKTGYGFFVGMDITVGGQKTNLKKLEDVEVREAFADPRIHAALNCASKGCPRLPQIAFDPAKLDEQLDAGMTEFVGEARTVAVDDAARTVTLSKIFDWFEKDFLAYEKAKGNPNGNVIDYVNRYRGSLPKLPRDYKVKYFDYDKSLNRTA